VGYFAQRFAAEPEPAVIRRIVLPNTLKCKLRLVYIYIYIYMLVYGALSY
jgi:hypothetical protein